MLCREALCSFTKTLIINYYLWVIPCQINAKNRHPSQISPKSSAGSSEDFSDSGNADDFSDSERRYK